MSKQQPTASEQMEAMRNEVILQELSARSWKAMRSKMEDTLVIDSIQEQYDLVVKKMDEKRKKDQEDYNDMIAKLQEQLKPEVVNG